MLRQQQHSRLHPQWCPPFVNGSTDACECPLREEGRDRLCDGQPAQGAQRPEYADMEGPARPPSRMRRMMPPCAASS